MGQVGCIYLNFGLWALAIVPSWLVIRQFGLHSDDKKVDRERSRLDGDEGKTSGVARNEGAV
jgi:hypothetical protein